MFEFSMAVLALRPRPRRAVRDLPAGAQGRHDAQLRAVRPPVPWVVRTARREVAPRIVSGVLLVRAERCVVCGWRLNDGEAGHEPHQLPESDPLAGQAAFAECLSIRERQDELPDLAGFMDTPVGGLVVVGEHVAEQWKSAV